MRIEVSKDSNSAAQRAAAFIADAASAAVTARGLFTMAVSGGATPWRMLLELAVSDVPWQALHLFQVDERFAPRGSADRNWTHVEQSLLERVPLPRDKTHPMPVDQTNVAAAARDYQRLLAAVVGDPAVLDLVQLGLGDDGHTASLVPGDPALEVTDRNVTVTGVYRGWRRMTLTLPMINRARCVAWLVTGSSKARIFKHLMQREDWLPASRVSVERAVFFVDETAAALCVAAHE